jgi:integrase/recombinase XerD
MGIRTVIDRESVDEIIYTSSKMRDRLILELQARAGMRIGEVLKLTPNDIDGVRVRIRNPKSGREQETVFITRRISERLGIYIRDRCIGPGERIFPMSYNGARLVVKRAGKSRGLNLTPHDLRRHAATFASRSGVPLEVVSKIILWHRNLSTTQRYLGKISEAEAASWIDRIYE